MALNDLHALKGAMQILKENKISGKKSVFLSIEAVEPDPENPRKKYSQTEIEELARSIASLGLLQAISVREAKDKPGKYYTNYGARRVLAIKWLHENMPDNEHSSEVEAHINNNFNSRGKLVENIQREGLSAIEIAEALKDEVETGATVADLMAELGKDKSWVSRHLKLNQISPFIRDLIDQNYVSNVEAILNLDNVYRKDEGTLIGLIGNLGEDKTITLALSRKWLKSIKEVENKVEPEEEQIEVQKQESTEDFELIQGEKNTSEELAIDEHETTDKDSNDEIDQLKSLQIEAEKLVNKPGKTEKSKKNTLSDGLHSEYTNGIFMSYQNLVLLATDNEDEAEARLSKHILRSFAKSNTSLNWEAVGEYPGLLEEVIQILNGFQSVGFISPYALKDPLVDNLINQQDLI